MCVWPADLLATRLDDLADEQLIRARREGAHKTSLDESAPWSRRAYVTAWRAYRLR